MKRIWLFPLLTAAAFVLPQPATAAPLERQPYLQCGTPTEMTVVWTTLVDSSGAVEYGTSPDNLGTTVDSPVNDTQHEVRLTGLQPDTEYFYRVISDGAAEAGGDQNHRFRTPPTAGTTAKLRAWVVGDSGTGGSMQAMVRDAMIETTGFSPPDIYLHVGDMAYSDGTYNEFTSNFYAPYQDILRNTVVWPSIGNHEGSTSNSNNESGPYYDGYVLPTGGEAGGLASGTEAYYSFDWGNVHFVVLDSHGTNRDPDGAMLTWVANDLASTTQDWVISYWHHPPYTKGSHDSDNEGALIDMRENALPILEAGGVDLVLGGHSHIYERSWLLDGAYATPSVAGDGVLDASDGLVLGDGPYVKAPGLPAHDGAIYIVAGHGGTGVSQDDTHPLMYFTEMANGSCVLDVQDNRLTVMNVRWDGEVTDRVDLVKGDAIVVAQPNGGETLGAGVPYDVRWATEGSVDNVALEYSTNNGDDWTVIEESVPNTGTYEWAVPGVDSDYGLIRVRDADGGALVDESNGVFSMSSQSDIDVIGWGADWRYHDQGEDLGDGWMASDYDDSAWPTGPAQLGYGDDDEATVLVDAEPNYPSAYFRTGFTITDEPVGAELSVLYDDGAAVWLNGVEVWRANVDDVSYGAFASLQSDDNEVQTVTLDAANLIEGDNVVAVIAKQNSGGSSDLSFDMQLTVTVMHDPPPPPPPDDTGDGDAGADTANGDDSAPDGDGGTTLGNADAGQDGGGGTLGTGGATDGLTAGANDDGGGCSCRTDGSGGRQWPLLLLMLPVLARRRTRNARR
ncbi:MAG: metallophosphoesterase family protein [Myxococcota bacterium]